MHNEPIFARVSAGASLVAASSTAAKNLLIQYSHWKKSSGEKVWPAAKIFSWSHWIEQCWNECCQQQLIEQTLLSDWQRRLAFAKVINQDLYRSGQGQLWNKTQSVAQAIKAWQLCYDYQLCVEQWSMVSDDVRVFKRWHQAYAKLLQQNDWIDPAQLGNFLIDRAYQPSTTELIFYAFEFNPAQKKWLEYLEKQDVCAIRYFEPAPVVNNKIELESYESFAHELTAAASWAKTEFQRDSSQPIAIVVPQLKAVRQQVEAVFEQVFNPSFQYYDGQLKAYSLSVTKSATEYAFIDGGLNLLQLLAGGFEYDQFSLFLRSRAFIGRFEASHRYCVLDAALRGQVQPQETLPRLLQLITNFLADQPQSYQRLVQQLQQLLDLKSNWPDKASPVYWCGEFVAALRIVGWPDLEELTQDEQRLLDIWQSALTELCTGGLISQTISYKQALQQLLELLEIKSFNNNSEAKIKVIDLAEIEQAEFSQAWFTGLNDTVLPLRTKLNPLIPIELQRQHELPFSSSQWCHKQTLKQKQALLSVATTSRYSYFRQDESLELRPSPIADEQLHHEVEAIDDFLRSSDVLFESYCDDEGLALTGDNLSGGTYLLKSQSACPFMAYASHRLQANPLEIPKPGVSAAIKGVLVHSVLRAIWNQLKSQQQLLEIQQQKLADLVAQTVANVLKSLHPEQRVFSPIEQTRLMQLMLNWLRLEAQRSVAFTVSQQEFKLNYQINNFTLELQVDRMDQLESGEQVLIDYKTGNADSNQWVRDLARIEDPQLPIYYLAVEDHVDGLMFALVREAKFDGIADGDVGVQGVSDLEKQRKRHLKEHQVTSLAQLSKFWQQSVATLVKEYAAGFAAVSPRDPARQCGYCQRQSLCRIYDQQNGVSQDETAD